MHTIGGAVLIGSHIRGLRLELNLTQSDLAEASGVSLPFIQRIEQDRVNPSYSIVTALLNALGQEISIVAKPIDWDFLAACGVAVMPSQTLALIPSQEQLVQALRHAFVHTSRMSDSRERMALEAWLLAVRDHFPKFLQMHFEKKFIAAHFPKVISGKHLKLRRMSLDRLKNIL